MAAYYPRKVATIKDLLAAYPEMEGENEAEEDRLESIRMYVLQDTGRLRRSLTIL